ncbi:MAG: hypothetical protein FJ333_10450, partial [Sphingomonadales bacterium]|nr:hypothetical protein [Sphingomonadales bacterium]
MLTLFVPFSFAGELSAVFFRSFTPVFPEILPFVPENIRTEMGLPRDWQEVASWLSAPVPARVSQTDPMLNFVPKHPEIPVLSSYKKPAPVSFWRNFPITRLPSAPKSPINIPALQAAVAGVAHLMDHAQLERARQAVAELSYGVDALQASALPQLRSKNSGSVFHHGVIFTDILAAWLEEGYVCGPFLTPPGPNFRSNQMLAIQQKEKIRVIMNLSYPKGQSFNDNVKVHMMEKVEMTTAREFGYAAVEAGPGAHMWKFDLKDAYKNMPARLDDTPAQGFQWLGRYFVESQQCFGARTAVAAYDRLGNTLLLIAALRAGVPQHRLLRCLDDVPIVAPAGSNWGHDLARHYKEVCAEVGARLAPACPAKDKAFEDSQFGTVLGVHFDTTDLTWAWSPEKAATALSLVTAAAAGDAMQLPQVQSLVGLLNDFTQACPFMRAFRIPIIAFLTSFHDDEEIMKTAPAQARSDLNVWAAAISRSVGRLPIAHRPMPVPCTALNFVSDAAGAKFARVNGQHVPVGDNAGLGVAAIGVRDQGHFWFAHVVPWPSFLLNHARDAASKAYG